MNQEAHNKKLLDYMKSLEEEVMDCEEMDVEELNQQLSEVYKSLENEVSNSQKMDKSALEQQQLDLIKSLEDEGVVDCYFRLSYSLKEDQGPCSFLELLPNFLRNARTVMQHMDTALESPVVDFDVLEGHCIKLKGSSSCIGACKVAKECYDFIRAIDKKSKDGCLQALRNIKREYHDLQDKLESIIQLEKEIVSAGSSPVMISQP